MVGAAWARDRAKFVVTRLMGAGIGLESSDSGAVRIHRSGHAGCSRRSHDQEGLIPETLARRADWAFPTPAN